MRTLVRNWWALALRGVLAIVFGAAAIAAPGIGLAALLWLYAVFVFSYGVLGIVSAARAASGGENWGSLLLSGLFSMIAGVVAVIWPQITALAFVLLLGAWAIATGIFEVVAAVRLREHLANEWLMALGGVLAIVFGVIVALRPGAGLYAIVFLLGLYAILQGVNQVALGLRLKAVESHLGTPEPTP